MVGDLQGLVYQPSIIMICRGLRAHQTVAVATISEKYGVMLVCRSKQHMGMVHMISNGNYVAIA